MSADKDRAVRREKQKRAKALKKQARQRTAAPAAAPRRTSADAPAQKAGSGG